MESKEIFANVFSHNGYMGPYEAITRDGISATGSDDRDHGVVVAPSGK
jgi:hypothetical protein